MPARANTSLVVRHASMVFGTKAAVKDVSFSVRAGESVAIVGPSGSGKTTLLRLISGALSGTGEIIHGGRLGIVYQDGKLLPWMTVEDNIRLSSAADAIPQLDRWLDIAGLKARLRSYPYHLSGGQRQRVALLRALVRMPDILLLDEPFSALDFLAKAKVRDLVQDISSVLGLTLITVTHDLDDALRLANRVLVMNDGSIVGDLDVDAMMDKQGADPKAWIEGLY